MLSKREKLYQAAEGLNALRCPVCGGDLTRVGDDFACEKRHRVNVNRKGCLNFLSAPVDSCYDAALFQARRRVFAAGCYQPVAEALEAMLPQGEQRLLDAGIQVCTIEELQQKAEQIVGVPEPIQYTDKVVGVVTYRDGSVMDLIHQVKE